MAVQMLTLAHSATETSGPRYGRWAKSPDLHRARTTGGAFIPFPQNSHFGCLDIGPKAPQQPAPCMPICMPKPLSSLRPIKYGALRFPSPSRIPCKSPRQRSLPGAFAFQCATHIRAWKIKLSPFSTAAVLPPTTTWQPHTIGIPLQGSSTQPESIATQQANCWSPIRLL